eukprot:TRINITY_DN105090_c0_g1_i1.p1 TRINITY_DN105090_c0_g1~~TRINITY_DN105090_c0_g1_i1.p1  ORF type:complete len:276 (-),score=63.78 TRINITY_DN105090_c0_g1_i1:41-868(-)
MKVTLKYEEPEKEELHMTLRLTLPQKYVSGTNKEVVKLFVDHYNKKHPDNSISVDDLHLKIVGGSHLDNEDRVKESLGSNDECYLLGKDSQGPVKKSKEPEAGYSAAAASKPAASAAKGPVKNADGKIRCKNFGCQQYFDPENPGECQHHKSPPIFHETAKWWSCCPDSKAYEFEEFMAIPGCQKGTHSAEGSGQKRALGGCDLRAESAPIRLDADAAPDARQKLGAIRKGLVAIGVDAELFDKVLGKLAGGGDLDKACEILKSRFSSAMATADV